VDSLVEMSNAGNRFTLYEIGLAAAEKQVEQGHFDERFLPGSEGSGNNAVKHFSKDSVPDLAFKMATKKPIAIRCYQMDQPFEVETMEGVLRGRAGDYLMVGVNNELYPCAKEVFDKTYSMQP
jgi:hypothetical protein